MSPHGKSRLPLRALLLALMILPTVAVFVGIPWLKQQPDAVVFLLSGLAAALTIVASFALALLHDRHIDEWQRSNAGFSSQWGWTAGASLIALLLALPPFRFGAVVVAQGLCTALISMGWAWWMSRGVRDPS
jgi:hypothetical protein